jgi:hypothetical protein
MLALPGVVIALAATVLIREARVSAAVARVDRQMRDEAAAPLLAELPPATADRPARAMLADALLLARWAEGRPLSDPERQRRLEEADRLATRAARSRPYWGEAWSVTAFARALAAPGGAGGESADRALAESYRATPFLRYSADWRVSYGLRAYDRLDPVSRSRIIDEAAWLLRNEGPQRRAVLSAARQSAAYAPVMLRWRLLRIARRRVGRMAP